MTRSPVISFSCLCDVKKQKILRCVFVSLPIPGLVPVTDGLHLLQNRVLPEVDPGIRPADELHVLIWNSYSVRGLKLSTLIKPLLSSVSSLSSYETSGDQVACCLIKADAVSDHKAFILPRGHYVCRA